MKNKKLLVNIFAISLVFVPFLSHASSTWGDYTYTINSDGVSVTLDGYNGSGGDLVIPETIDISSVDYSVTIINGSMSPSNNVTSVVIPSSVESIGGGAFSGATNLTSVTLNEGLITITDAAFSSSSITSITIPDSVTTITNGAFSGTSSILLLI